MAGDLDSDVSPLAIPDVERVVVDVGMGFFHSRWCLPVASQRGA
jgi:hypothetical protein